MAKTRFRVVGYSIDPKTGREMVENLQDIPARGWSYKPRHAKKWMKQGGCHRVTEQLVRY